MTNIKHHILAITVGLFITTLSSCVLIDTDKNEEAIEKAAIAAVSQVTYSTLQKDEAKYKPVFEAIVVALKKLDTSVDMSPAEIAIYIQDELAKKVTGDYRLIIAGAVDAIFTKYNIGWSDKVPAEKLHRYIQDAIKAIELGISEYEKTKEK